MARPRRFLSLAAPLDVASARIALFGYLLAAQAGAAVGVRFVDDIGDAPASFSALADDLAWLGISIAGEPLQTSARGDLYGEHVQRLVAAGHARVDADKTLLRVPSGQTVIDDAVKGAVVFDNRALGEITLVNSDGSVSGTLRDAVDDALLATSPVVRDDRQLEHSARGRLILDALALPSPRYAHVGALIPDTPETELPSIAQLRRAGFLPGPVIDHLALLGAALPGAQESSDWPQRIAHFSLERLGHGPAHFNEPRLRALNARALRTLTGDKLAALVAAAMQRAGLLEDPIPAAAQRWITTFLSAYGAQFTTLGEALALVAELRAEAVVVPALELERLRNRQVVFFLDAVSQYVDAQPELRDLPLDHDLPVIAGEFGIAHDDAFAALRMALTGKRDGAPLGLLFALLGHDRILIRIGAISSHLLHGRGLEPIRFGPGGVPFTTIQPSRPAEH